MTTVTHTLTAAEDFGIDVAIRVLHMEKEPELVSLVFHGLLTPDEAMRILDGDQWWQVCSQVPAIEALP